MSMTTLGSDWEILESPCECGIEPSGSISHGVIQLVNDKTVFPWSYDLMHVSLEIVMKIIRANTLTHQTHRDKPSAKTSKLTTKDKRTTRRQHRTNNKTSSSQAIRLACNNHNHSRFLNPSNLLSHKTSNNSNTGQKRAYRALKQPEGRCSLNGDLPAGSVARVERSGPNNGTGSSEEPSNRRVGVTLSLRKGLVLSLHFSLTVSRLHTLGLGQYWTSLEGCLILWYRSLLKFMSNLNNFILVTTISSEIQLLGNIGADPTSALHGLEDNSLLTSDRMR